MFNTTYYSLSKCWSKRSSSLSCESKLWKTNSTESWDFNPVGTYLLPVCSYNFNSNYFCSSNWR